MDNKPSPNDEPLAKGAMDLNVEPVAQASFGVAYDPAPPVPIECHQVSGSYNGGEVQKLDY